MISTQRMSIDTFYNIWETWIHAHMLHRKNLCETSLSYVIIFLYFSSFYYERMMTMEQILQQILQKLDNLENGQKVMAERQIAFEERQIAFEQRQISFEERQIAFEETQKTFQSGQKELFDIVKAIHHRQEETDAKIDSLAMDIHKLHGDVTFLKEHALHVDQELADIKSELDFTSHKTYRNEVEIFKLRKAQGEH